jgi:nicotinate-nucleotide adenylyltransferase
MPGTGSTAGSRTGVLGGTFDPPHIGHLLAAINVRHALALDEVLLVVANDPWQKTGSRPITPAEDRLAMVRAATDGLDRLTASDVELARGGPSYMVDTLTELGERDPAGERFLILGADAAAGLPTWHRADDLPALATLVLVDRPGIPCPPPPAGWAFERVEIPRIELSSTELRARVAEGRPLDLLVTPGVWSCIRDRRLYGFGSS